MIITTNYELHISSLDPPAAAEDPEANSINRKNRECHPALGAGSHHTNQSVTSSEFSFAEATKIVSRSKTR